MNERAQHTLRRTQKYEEILGWHSNPILPEMSQPNIMQTPMVSDESKLLHAC
jgi:hypothetical protein